ncbi:hypothetical protein BCON_0184g00180 [Botryotinia convoluta]|uniref:Uncharacterized protein n=1 Tax=Botryotinia convoluta TaxID=54673 RepID=A0A4Z1I0A6_9HELO|nr:hypothetical protein BCON_0184g00180 [Botryotinia convoluta]
MFEPFLFNGSTKEECRKRGKILELFPIIQTIGKSSLDSLEKKRPNIHPTRYDIKSHNLSTYEYLELMPSHPTAVEQKAQV